MNEKMYCEVPRFKIFDFHRHASEMNDFEKNLKEFNVGKFCLMPTTLENDFQDILSYIEKIKLYHDKFKDDAIREIASLSLERESGARGLRAVLENIMLNLMFEIPSMSNILKVIISKDVVLGKSSPEIVFNEEIKTA